MTKDPKNVHRDDQLGAAIIDMASQMGTYFKGLTSMGLTRAEALQLTIAYQTQMMQNIYAQARENRLKATMPGSHEGSDEDKGQGS